MKIGDLVKWIGRTSEKFPGPRMAIVLDKDPEHGSSYWRVLFEGKAICMDEAYLEVIHESG